MTQIILEVKDASILPALEKTLSLMKGVTIETITDVPNVKTTKAIKEAKTGKVTRFKNSKEMITALQK